MILWCPSFLQASFSCQPFVCLVSVDSKSSVSLCSCQLCWSEPNWRHWSSLRIRPCQLRELPLWLICRQGKIQEGRQLLRMPRTHQRSHLAQGRQLSKSLMRLGRALHFWYHCACSKLVVWMMMSYLGKVKNPSVALDAFQVLLSFWDLYSISILPRT